jgi:hypothetical protein
MDSMTRMSQNDSAAHRKGMALKNLIARHKKRRRDAGVGFVDTVVGIGLATIIIGGPILYFTTVSNTAAGNASTQSQNTAISEALDRTVANIQASDTIVYAGPNELVTRSTEVDPGKADNPVVTRWVVNDTTLYQQAWSGTAGVAAYDRSTLPTVAGGDANQVTRVSVANLQLDGGQLFTYTDKDGAGIDVKAPKWALTENARTNPADGKKTYDIALVNIAIKAGTSVKDKNGIVENKTSAAPRSVSGKSNGLVDVPQCPPLRIDTNPAGKPVITWTTLAGYTSYAVFRNTGQIAVVNAAASDTQKSYTDAAVTAAPTDAIQYRVQSRNADGTMASIACAPTTWSPQIDAPVFKNSSVLPTADQAHEWTDGADKALNLKKPRIVLNWDTVPGASSYDLNYRELDAATGTPLTTAFNSAAAGIPAGKTTFTWNEGGWGARYEWFIKANAGVGQSKESARITTLTHPPAPQNVDVSAQYGVGATRLTKGNNVITWSAAATAVEYDIWRYNSGDKGAVMKLVTVKAASPRTYTDTVPYGTTWTYYVAAVNEGPRGTTSGKASSANPEAGVASATGTMPTVSYREPAAGSTMSTMAFAGNTVTIERAASVKQTDVKPAPQKATQLQFPPVPAMIPVSDDPTKTRDLEGINQVVWNPVLSAVSYLPVRTKPMDSKVTCLAGDCTAGTGGLTGTKLTDNAAKASQYDYAVKAVNATGVSVEFAADVRLTQRPATPPLTVTDRPDLQSSGATFVTKANGDAGNDGANRFCTAATCRYELTYNGQVIVDAGHPAAGTGADVSLRATSLQEGVTVTIGARAKNEARTNKGYSDSTSASVDTYPGDFGSNHWLGDKNGNGRERFMASVTSTDAAGSTTAVGTPGWTTVSWGSSAGAASITTARIAVASDTVSNDGSLGLPSTADDDTKTFKGGSSGTQSGWAAPGATYKYKIVATGKNGLQRPVTTSNIVTPADVPRHAKVIITCSGNQYTNQTTAAYNYPNHYIGAKLINLDKKPLYGAWGGTSIWGQEKRSKTSAFLTNPNSRWLTPADANADVLSGPGVGYYQGVASGFEVQTAGAGGPSSAKIRVMMRADATFSSGCGPYGGRWDKLDEPDWPCYGYVIGQPCKAVNNENRPQWTSK